MTTTTTIDTPCDAYMAMAKRWELIDALRGGTEAMRDGGTKWLPKEPAEEEKAYQTRLLRSFLYEAYNDTVANITSKPFSKPVTIQGELPEPLSHLKANANGIDQNITQFASEVFSKAIDRGLTHILVDFPEMQEGISLAEEKQSGAGAVFVHVTPEQIISWRAEKGQLTQICIRESKTEPVGEWGEQIVEFIRVYRTNDWALYKKSEGDKEFVKTNEGMHTFKGVPLVTCYFNQTGFMTAKPTLEALAWMNLRHYQSSSDQNNILRFARTGFYFGAGFTQEEIEKGFKVGANQSFLVENEKAHLDVVEYTGASINAGKDDLEAIEANMEVLGLQPLMRKAGQQTATGQTIDADNVGCKAQAWIRALENALQTAFIYAGMWTNTKLPSDLKLDIFSDFAITMKGAKDIDNLLKARIAGELSRETFLSEIQRRGTVGETMKVDEEIERINSEGPALGTIGKDGQRI